MASLFIVSLIVLFLIWLLIKRLVLERISRHMEHINSIQRSGNLSERVPVEGEDEIASLARQFNAMMENLKEARQELLEQSYKLGRAEMAAGTLHNIRNAFNPLLNRVVRVAQRVDESPAINLHSAIAELLDGKADEERAAKLQQYATMAASELAEMHGQLHAEMTTVKQQIGDIEQMLTRQNVVGDAKPPIESVAVEEVISSALELLPVRLSERVKVVVDGNLADTAPVAAYKTNLVQVMQNLLINAAESIHSCDSPDSEIRINAERTVEEGQDLVHIVVTDKGVGLDEDATTAIFQRDYSTKPDGKGGLGLHWCANTVASMDGRMYAESEGAGTGATIHLLIPAAA
jgi:signal transduction histidine kinase